MDRRAQPPKDRRPQPPKDLEDVLDRLHELGVFGTKQKGMMFAAALGYWRKARIPLKSRGTGIRYDVFVNVRDDAFIDALAVAVTGDLQVLSSERLDERITTFEEYAHGGLEEMKRVCFEEHGDPLENLIRLTSEVRGAATDIPGIDPNVLRGMLG